MAVFSAGSGALDEDEFEAAVAAAGAVSFLVLTGLLVIDAAIAVLPESFGAVTAAEEGDDGTETAAEGDVPVDAAAVDDAAGGGADAASVAESEGAACAVA